MGRLVMSLPWQSLPINLSTFALSQNPFQQSSPCSQNQPRVGTLFFVLPVPSAEERQMARYMIPSSQMAQETLVVVYFTALNTSQLNYVLVHKIFSMLTSTCSSLFSRGKSKT